MNFIQKNFFFFLFIISILFTYYTLAYLVFIKKESISTYPVLKTRLGNILWQKPLVDKSTTLSKFHTYCYYPSNHNNSGEYIIKKAERFKDCQNWYGIIEIQELENESEKEKIHWPS